MSSAARAQWRHMWRTLVQYEGDRKARVDAWCARIDWVAKCEPPQAWSSDTSCRSNAWSMMDAESAAALLNTFLGEEALRQAGGDVAWSVGRAKNHGMPMLKVPPETAALVMHGLWKELMCPAPYSKTLFAVPAQLKNKRAFADEFPEMAMSRTLHPRGEVHLDAADAFALSDLPEGDYQLVVEAAREVGGREVVRLPFQWPATGNKTVRADGEQELGRVQLRLAP